MRRSVKFGLIVLTSVWKVHSAARNYDNTFVPHCFTAVGSSLPSARSLFSEDEIGCF